MAKQSERHFPFSEKRLGELAAPRTGQIDYWDTSSQSPGGFGLRIGASGRRTWVLATRERGKHATRHAIGDPARLSLKEARARAWEFHDRIKFAPPPGPEAGSTATVTFGAIRDEFLRRYPRERNRAGNLPRDKTVRNYRLGLEHPVISGWTDVPISEVTKALVQSTLRPYAGEHPVMSNRIFSVVRATLRWAEGNIDGFETPNLGDRPGGRETARARVLSDVELTCVLQAIDQLLPLRDLGTRSHRNVIAGALLQLLALLGQRAGEVAGMRWSELSLDGPGGPLWTLPPSRTKNRHEHVVPLAPAVLKVIQALPRWHGCDYVLSTSGKGPATADTFAVRSAVGKRAREIAVERRAKGAFKTPWTAHDLRRTCRTGMARLGVRPDVAERAVGHYRSDVQAIYDWHSYAAEVREALEKWADHVEGLMVLS